MYNNMTDKNLFDAINALYDLTFYQPSVDQAMQINYLKASLSMELFNRWNR